MIYVAAALLLVGSLFCVVAALGLVRFPDLYTRLHAAAKAGPIGAGLVLLGDLYTLATGSMESVDNYIKEDGEDA